MSWEYFDKIPFDAIGVAVAAFFGIYAIRYDILKELKASQIDEKISKIWGYAIDVKNWEREGSVKIYRTQQILSEIRSIERIKKSITYQQEVKLDDAFTSLVGQMISHGYDAESKQIQDALLGIGIDDDKSVWGDLRDGFKNKT